MQEQELQGSYLEGFQDGIKTLHDNAYQKGVEIGSNLLKEAIKRKVPLADYRDFSEIVEISKSFNLNSSKSLSW